jgi:hypothetical protein
MIPFPDVSKLSSIAIELERRFPTASVGEIYAMAKPTVEGAIAVAAGQSRNDGLYLFPYLPLIIASSVLFANHVLGSTTPKSIPSQLPSGRHTPAPQPPFRMPSHTPQSHTPQLQHQQIPSHPQQSETGGPSYDMESWFDTFPSTSTTAPASSSEFTQFHVSTRWADLILEH